jgi:cyclopropane-fatty-acyl-phospholipid synthase
MSAIAQSPPFPSSLKSRKIDRWTRLALAMANMIKLGTLTVVLADGATHHVVRTAEPEATFIIRDSSAIRRLIIGGSLGLAEAYIEGLWESPDVGAVMRLAAANEAQWLETLRGRPLVRLVSRVLHWRRGNSRSGAKRNIIDHYDLGNEFYAAWLDQGMVYSAALFKSPDQSLEQAQDEKMHALCRALDLQPGMRLLEIGCGWGGFAELAARDYGVHVTGLTLSPSQLEWARGRIERAGLTDQVELRLEDYRDVRGQFDRIASIEMFEAVGEKYWPVYFDVLRERLRPGGRAGLQTITIADHLWSDYATNADFIQRHVFPGGMLPSLCRLTQHAREAGLAWAGEHWFGADYAETLARWQTSFQSRWPHIANLSGGFDLRFKRLWEYYLSYCETGFRAGWTDVGQIVLTRPG